MEPNKCVQTLRKGIITGLGIPGRNVVPWREKKRPEGPFVTVNTALFTQRGVPSVLSAASRETAVDKVVLTHYRVEYMVDFIRGDAQQRIWELHAWLRTEAAQTHFIQAGMTFIGVGSTTDLTTLETYEYTPRIQTELIFNVGVIASEHEVPTAVRVDIGGDREFSIDL